MALFTLAAIVCFLVLTVWSWGDLTFFDHPARVALVVVTLILTVVSLFAKPSGFRSGKTEDRKNRWIFVPFILLTLAFLCLTPWSDRHHWLVMDGDFVRYSGVVIYTIGGIFRLYPVFVLGWRFSPVVAIQQGHTLATTGIYGKIRHPSYLGLLLGMFGWALVFRSVIGLVISMFFVPVLIARMNSEEALLASEFGSEYQKYRLRTWRLIPWVY